MSGGVDSSVAAALLAEQGHDVIGLSMQLYDQRGGRAAFGTCCTLDDLHDARRVAAALGIPHYIVNFERQFDETVVANFVREYLAGPHAASLRALQQRPEVRRAARPRGRRSAPTRVATGHYARVGTSDAATGRWRLLPRRRPGEGPVLLPVLADPGAAGARAVPGRRPARRPTCASTREASACPWPTSPTARRSASSPTATTPRSSSAARPAPIRPGAVVDAAGRVLGRHDGMHHFTVGQRKGLGLSVAGAALRRRASTRRRATVVVGPRERRSSGRR